MKLKKRIVMFWIVCLVWLLPLSAKAENRVMSMGTLLFNGQFQEFSLSEETDQKHIIHIQTPGQLKINFQTKSVGNYVQIFSKEIEKDVLYFEKCPMEGSDAELEKCTVLLDLMPGEYYLLYKNMGSVGTYKIKAVFTPAVSEEAEPNNTEETAMPFVFGTTINGFISSRSLNWERSEKLDYEDWYSFEIKERQAVVLRYRAIDPKHVLAVQVRQGSTIFFSDVMRGEYGTSTEEVELRMPGTYYVRISDMVGFAGDFSGWHNSGSYSLSLSPNAATNMIYTDPYTGVTYKILPDNINGVYKAAVINLEDKAAASVVIPDIIEIGTRTVRIVEIGKKAFAGCKNLQKITIGNYVKLIGEKAFSGCTALTQIKGMEEVEDIGKQAFRKCTALKQLRIRSPYLENIHLYAFSGCERLENITIDSKRLYMIGKRAFNGCRSLKKVTIKSVRLKLAGKKMFYKTSGKCVVRVPQLKVKGYRLLLANEIKEAGIRVKRIKKQ